MATLLIKKRLNGISLMEHPLKPPRPFLSHLVDYELQNDTHINTLKTIA